VCRGSLQGEYEAALSGFLRNLTIFAAGPGAYAFYFQHYPALSCFMPERLREEGGMVMTHFALDTPADCQTVAPHAIASHAILAQCFSTRQIPGAEFLVDGFGVKSAPGDASWLPKGEKALFAWEPPIVPPSGRPGLG
jgi:hypothetical protein